jgi:hypothetical protein
MLKLSTYKTICCHKLLDNHAAELKIEAVYFFKLLVLIYMIAWCHSSEGQSLNILILLIHWVHRHSSSFGIVNK